MLKVGRPIQTCEQVLGKKNCSFVHRCNYNNNVCDVFENYFEFKTTSVNTRNNGKKLIIPRFKLEAFRAAFKFQRVKLFNLLSVDARILISS